MCCRRYVDIKYVRNVTRVQENIEVVIVLADKYGMPGLLLLCEEFLLGRGGGGGGGSSRAGGGNVFSCEAEDPAYVWKWLRRADRLRMERVRSV